MGKRIRKIPLSAKTGQFVTQEYAATHPSTTVVITVKPTPAASKGK